MAEYEADGWGEYCVDGRWRAVEQTHEHGWHCVGFGVTQEVYWYREHGFLVEVQEAGEARYLYRFTDAEAEAMLRRYGHGPNLWRCACIPCTCPMCGQSWHLHGPDCVE
jgi:hypothetical protein